MANIENKKVIIDLAKSMNSRFFEELDIIHKTEFDRATRLIDNKIGRIDENRSNHTEIRNRYNDTITILGSRGSGKTSFLMSVLHKYEAHEKVEVIELIDPTLIEEKGHIFLTLISLIRNKVENKIIKDECNPHSSNYRLRKCWENKLKKLAAGLPSIDIDSDSLYSNWHDPEHVMQKGLEAVNAAKELEQNFNDIVKNALEILDKKAFLIAFDDIDVNFNNGWKVLETIRKYLTSPQIITLLSGDIKLFSKAIRKQQWINFGDELLKNEGERLNNIDTYDELVTELESQYMQKIMKAPNRIHLSTIGEMLNSREITVCINKEDKDIYEHYTDLLKDWGINNMYEAYSVVSYLLTLPLRTQIQLLKQFEYVREKNLNILNITDAFVSDLYELGVDVELAKSQPKDFCYITHKFLLDEKLLNETYQLLPTSGSVNYNAVLFSLYTMFIAHSKNNPSILFEYWIAIVTIKNLLTIMPYYCDNEKDATITPTIDGISEYSFIGQKKVYRDICSYLSTYIRAALNNKSENKNPWGGTMILKGLARKSRHKKEDRIDLVFEKKSLMSKQLAFFPMSIASYAHKQRSIVVYSFYTLLGTIVELLKRYDIIKRNINKPVEDVESKEKKEPVKYIATLLNELSQVKDNIMPTFGRNYDNVDDDIAYNITEIDQKDEDSHLAKVLYEWICNYPQCIPPHLIGKTATRAFYAMRSLDDKTLKNEELNLGDAMHRRIVIVMNSALVEDAKENLENSNLSNNNPVESNLIFSTNLDRINELKDEYKNKLMFSRWIFTCPLFLLYMNNGGKEGTKNNETTYINNIWKKLSQYFGIYKSIDNLKPSAETDQVTNDNNNDKIMEWFKKSSIYSELKRVAINGRGAAKSPKEPKAKTAKKTEAAES